MKKHVTAPFVVREWMVKKMSDYIKREDVWKRFARCFDGKAADIILEDLPSADVAPVRHGRWIEYGENKDGTHNICCSVCDGFLKSKGHANSCYTRNKYRYCPNCGARMDGESDE